MTIRKKLECFLPFAICVALVTLPLTARWGHASVLGVTAGCIAALLGLASLWAGFMEYYGDPIVIGFGAILTVSGALLIANQPGMPLFDLGVPGPVAIGGVTLILLFCHQFSHQPCSRDIEENVLR